MPSRKLVIIMVGLPARGKTFLSLRLQRYLEWQGYSVRIFNVGGYRRRILGPVSSRSEFFDPHIRAYAAERERVARRCFGDLSGWLDAEGDVAIYDATNVTSSRRGYLGGECGARGFDHIFVESVCDDPAILENIVNVKITNSDDYRERDRESAERDFRARISHYESVYEPVSGVVPSIKFFNFGEKVSRNFAPGQTLLEEIAEFLGSVNLAEKEVYITRHGETFFNLEDRIGGDSSLTEKGIGFARKLSGYFKGRDLVVFTSAKSRTIETADFLGREKVRLEELNEINSGVCDGLTYDEIASRYPEIQSSRNADKFNFRYPGGESYRDLIQRVRKAVIRIETEKRDVLVIAHRAVNRCLFSYFVPTAPKDIPYLDMPLNRVIRVYHQKALYGHEALTI